MGSNDRKTTFRLVEDGLPYDDVPHVSASEEQLRSFERAAEQMRQFKAPALLDPRDRHSYMIFGLLDGTGNDVTQDPLHPTNVARLKRQIEGLKEAGVRNIGYEYLPGPGTQTNAITNPLDGATGATALDRAEEMYWRLVRQAQAIYRNDPDAKINIHLEGFSRGASTVPMVARLIDERGIPDLDRPVLVQDASGKTVSTFPHLLKSPGQTPMSVGLYDPVPTGVQELIDRRLPPSVVSGFQINSADELRKPFPVDRIIPQGLSADGRFLSVSVSGVHADVGGWYLRSGLADRSMNLMTDYRNALLSQPLFQRLHETDDPRMNVVHQSNANFPFKYTGVADRASPEGEITRLTPDLTHATRPGEVVHVFEQGPEPANDLARRLHAQARSVERTRHVGSSEQTNGDGLMARLARNTDVELHPYDPNAEQLAKTRLGVRGGIVLEAGLIAYEWGDTYQRAQVFKHTLGNETAADNAYARQTAQTAGAITGTVAGATTATALGTGSGGTLVLVAVEGYVFSKAAERAVTMWQNDKIYTQTDTAGVEWEFNGRRWIRDDLRADLTVDGQAVAHPQSFSAQPEKARELSHLASVEAVEQALGKVPEPRSPFVQPKSDADSAHLEVTDWTYSAESGRWSRQIANGVDRRDMTDWEPEPEYASPERAAQLSAQAMAVIDDNLKAGPAAIAARYEVGHKAYGYPGQAPDAVAAALSPDLLHASDGKHYQRDAQGVWTHEGEVASANRTLELELTRERLVPALDLHQQTLANMPAWQPPTPEEADRALLRDLYLDNHWNPDIKPEQFEATYAAVQRTRAEHGIALGTTAFALDRDVNGGYSFNSPIQHTKLDASGVVQVVATTRPDGIALAADVRTSRSGDQDTPMQGAPERSIPSLSPQAQDAREQATREANRQGLSRDETQQTVQAAGVDATMRVISLGPSTPREAATVATDTPPTPRERAQDAPTTQDHAQAAAVAGMVQAARDDEAAQQGHERAQADRAPAANSSDRVHASPASESPPAAAHREPTPQPVPPVAQADPLPNRPGETSPTAPGDRESPQTTPPATGVPTAEDADSLRPGDRNDQVELLQYRLDRQGYRGPDDQPIPQDGRYGPETEHAVRQFQQDRALPVTGTADIATQYDIAQTRSARVEQPDAATPDIAHATGYTPNSPAHAIERPAEEAREARMQIVREAQRHGLSQDDIDQAVQGAHVERAPSPMMAATGGGTPHSEPGRDARAQDREDRAESPREPSVVASAAPPALVAGHRAASTEREDEQERDRHRDAPTPEAARVAPTLPSFDPRRPDHPEHGLYLSARDKVADLYERHGIPMPEDALERTTAAVMSDARANKMTQIEAIEFTATQKFGNVPDPDGKLVAWSHDPAEKVPWSKASLTDPASIDARDPDRDYARFREETIKEQQSLEAFQKTQEAINQNPTGPTMTMGARSLAMADASSDGDGGGGGDG